MVPYGTRVPVAMRHVTLLLTDKFSSSTVLRVVTVSRREMLYFTCRCILFAANGAV